jgi:hypothetical protein
MRRYDDGYDDDEQVVKWARRIGFSIAGLLTLLWVAFYVGLFILVFLGIKALA